MKNILLLTFLAFLAISCNSGYQNSAQEPAKNPLSEKVAEYPSINIQSIDSLYLENLEADFQNLNPLENEMVKAFNAVFQMPESPFHQNEFVNDFLQIESLKNGENNEEYVRNLDISRLRDAKAFLLGKQSLTDEKEGILWGVWFSSYEECPYYHGIDLYLTIFNADSLDKTLKVGSSFSFLAPPIASNSPVYSKLENAILTITQAANEFDILDNGQFSIIKNETRIDTIEL
jgi:hypothetical protein